MARPVGQWVRSGGGIEPSRARRCSKSHGSGQWRKKIKSGGSGRVILTADPTVYQREVIRLVKSPPSTFLGPDVYHGDEEKRGVQGYQTSPGRLSLQPYECHRVLHGCFRATCYVQQCGSDQVRTYPLPRCQETALFSP